MRGTLAGDLDHRLRGVDTDDRCCARFRERAGRKALTAGHVHDIRASETGHEPEQSVDGSLVGTTSRLEKLVVPRRNPGTKPILRPEPSATAWHA